MTIVDLRGTLKIIKKNATLLVALTPDDKPLSVRVITDKTQGHLGHFIWTIIGRYIRRRSTEGPLSMYGHGEATSNLVPTPTADNTYKRLENEI